MAYKAALITGASSGIGEACARLLPPETDLLLTGRDGARLETLRLELARPGRRVEVLSADLATLEGIEAVAAAGERFGIDFFLNNAGFGRTGALIEDEARLQQAMAMVNVVAVVVLSRRLLPGMIAQARARGARAGLIVVASVVGFAPIPYFATYAASKAFDLHFSAALAAEMKGQPVDVLALCPGSTETRFSARTGSPDSLPRGHSAERVMREGLQALGKSSFHVVGGLNWLTTQAMRHMPMRLLTAIAAPIARRRTVSAGGKH